MGRIRTIKPEFWTDAIIVSLPFDVRLFYIGLWNFCDDYGSFPNEPLTLKLQIFPDDAFDVEDALDLLCLIERIVRCVDANGVPFYKIAHWSDHQRVDKPGKPMFVEDFRKTAIPQEERRKVAIKYGCVPGCTAVATCYYCGEPGQIHWFTRKDGRPSGWVTFGCLELDHFSPEIEGGKGEESNIVLACRSCNRRKNVKNGIQFAESKLNFQESPANGQGTIPPEWKGMERNGKEKEKKRNGMGADAPKQTRFIPPTQEEVKEYMAERKWLDPQGQSFKFVSHYTSKGWTVGKSGMKDWKACVHTWESPEKLGVPKDTVIPDVWRD